VEVALDPPVQDTLHLQWNMKYRVYIQFSGICSQFGSQIWSFVYLCRLISSCFTSRSRIFQSYVGIEGLQNIGLCLVLRAFEQGGIFIVPHLLYHNTVFSGLIRRAILYDTQGDAEHRRLYRLVALYYI
jgi:hypothetical protein